MLLVDTSKVSWPTSSTDYQCLRKKKKIQKFYMETFPTNDFDLYIKPKKY